MKLNGDSRLIPIRLLAYIDKYHKYILEPLCKNLPIPIYTKLLSKTPNCGKQNYLQRLGR